MHLKLHFRVISFRFERWVPLIQILPLSVMVILMIQADVPKRSRVVAMQRSEAKNHQEWIFGFQAPNMSTRHSRVHSAEEET